MTAVYTVQTDSLTKAFDGKEIVKQCMLQVGEGEIYGLLGPNGAGKTTVFKLISGLLSPTMGTVSVLGMSMRENRDAILAQIGTLIETPVFYEHLSADENLRIHLDYMNAEGDDIKGTLSMVGLMDTGRQPVAKFSLGMRQRLAIARAIIHRPKVVVLDEPTNGLDPIAIKEMRDFFVDLAKRRGMTLLISSHILTEIEHIADRIGIIAEGKLVQEATMAEIKHQYPAGLETFFVDALTRKDKI